MKIVAIGDIHGSAAWKPIVEKETCDKLVFIGDYFDTFDPVSPQRQKDNFKDILALKKAEPDKVILLFGNHDYHYLNTTDEQYSGFMTEQKTDIAELLQPAIEADLLQMCFVWENLLFTHAGVTKTWCQNNDVDTDSLEISLNDLLKYRPNAFRFTSGRNHSPYGDDVEQSPIWVRPRSLRRDGIDGYIQVVGHTEQKRLTIADDIIIIDALPTSGEYLVWQDGEVGVGEV